ncbi:MAG: hypothetical protein WCP39_06830, partial [Chlamydiota bacterium]
QAMYTNLYPTKFEENSIKIGMPGRHTTSLGNGRWIIPSEIAFPGLFSLFDCVPNFRIDFHNKMFDQEASQSFAELIAGNPRKLNDLRQFLEKNYPRFGKDYFVIRQKIREGDESLKNALRDLKETYDQLWAFCCLFSGLDDISLKS